jgi:hypothetical protein
MGWVIVLVWIAVSITATPLIGIALYRMKSMAEREVEHRIEANYPTHREAA